MYHQIGDFAPMKTHRATYCLHRRFAAQMALLHLLRYRVISLDEALKALSGRAPFPKRAVVLTFDDGYRNFYEYAFPILKRYRFPATVYLLSGLIGQKAEWFAADGRPCPPLLDRQEILTLAQEGVEFGSHGISHIKLAEADDQRLREEVFKSKKDLEELLGRPVRHFCYPYGNYDLRAIAAVREAGYLSAVTCIRGAALKGEDPFQLPRKAISYGDSLIGFLWKLELKNKRKSPPLQSKV